MTLLFIITYCAKFAATCSIFLSASAAGKVNRHTVCKECQKMPNKCPICVKRITKNYTSKDLIAEQLVAEIMVRCPNKSNGCLWKKNLPFLKKHFEMCPYAIKQEVLEVDSPKLKEE